MLHQLSLYQIDNKTKWIFSQFITKYRQSFQVDKSCALVWKWLWNLGPSLVKSFPYSDGSDTSLPRTFGVFHMMTAVLSRNLRYIISHLEFSISLVISQSPMLICSYSLFFSCDFSFPIKTINSQFLLGWNDSYIFSFLVTLKRVKSESWSKACRFIVRKRKRRIFYSLKLSGQTMRDFPILVFHDWYNKIPNTRWLVVQDQGTGRFNFF